MKKIIEFIAIFSILTMGSLTTAIAASHEKVEATTEAAAKTAETTTAEANTENTEKKKAAEEDEEPDCE